MLDKARQGSPFVASPPLLHLCRNIVLGKWDADTTRFLSGEACLGGWVRRASELRFRSGLASVLAGREAVLCLCLLRGCVSCSRLNPEAM